jgi:hypothetical protein
MTADEFILELAKVRTLFNWKAIPSRSQGPERRSKERLLIRGTSKDLVDGVVFDPIGALCYVRTGQAYHTVVWLEAARALRLREMDAWQLNAAANDVVYTQVGPDQRRLHPHLAALRSELTAAVGLQQAGADPQSGLTWL